MKSCFAVLLVAALAVCARAQIPYFGFCPEYLPMTGFDMERFLGVWYEAERNFQLSEIASRCVMSNYTRGLDNKFHVINEVRSRVTGIKRVLEGEIRKAPSKAEEGKLHVKYTSVPVISPETQYNVLETDYDNYAVLWSCSGVGPLNAQNAWIMTRQRLAPGEILQKAYGVLDKYRISKTFFLKTNQEDCAYDSLEPAKATEPPKQDIEEDEDEQTAAKSAAAVVSEVLADAPVEPVISTRNVEAEEKPIPAKKLEAEKPAAILAEPAKATQEEAPKSVPEVIMKIADQAKEQIKEAAKETAKEALAAEPVKEAIKELLKEEPIAEAAKESAPAAEEKKIEAIEKPATEIVEEKIEIVKP